MALPIDVIPHSLDILLLLAIPAIVSKLEYTHPFFELTTQYNSCKLDLWIQNKQLTVCGY
jgi:hypothetical protein